MFDRSLIGQPDPEADQSHCRWAPLQLDSRPGSRGTDPTSPGVPMSTMTLDTMFRPTTPMRVAGPRSTVRLTRRGRVVIIVAALIVAFAIGVFVTAAGSVATQEPEATRIIQVGTGDTLWDIAADLAEPGEVRAMMARIEKLNSLDSAALQ